MAIVTKIKEFFGYAMSLEFMNDWKALNDKEKEYFKVEVGKVLNK